MTKKEFGRMIAFALVVCLLLLVLCDLFELSDTTNIAMRYKTFDHLAENTVDAIWIGTSGVDRYWVAAKAYEEYGMTVFPMATDAMPTWLFINAIEEAYVSHSPELIIIDARAYGQQNQKSSTMDVRARRFLDSMNYFSVNRFKAAFKTMDTIQQATGSDSKFSLSLLLPYVKYHTKWADDDFTLKDNLSNAEHAYMGFFMNKSLSVDQPDLDPVVYDAEYCIEMDPVAEASLYELLDYVEENNLNVLFVDTPQMKTDREMGVANTLYKILEERGVSYINYCETDVEGNFVNGLDLDPDKDFYNAGHVNYYGADNFTEVFSAYLNENYDLPDRRNDENVKKDWDGIYAKIQKKIASWEEKAE